MKKKELLIIIPAYNEGENIQKVLHQIEGLEIDGKKIAALADILVINDASRDSTCQGTTIPHDLPAL